MVTMKRILATCGNGAFGRLGHGIECRSQTFLRIVGSLVGYNIKSVACGGAHTAVLTGATCGREGFDVHVALRPVDLFHAMPVWNCACNTPQHKPDCACKSRAADEFVVLMWAHVCHKQMTGRCSRLVKTIWASWGTARRTSLWR